MIEVSQRYDDLADCSPIKYDDFVSSCTVDIIIDAKIEGPVNIYYELKNFYQNHRTYVKSRDTEQLRGEKYEELKDLKAIEEKLIDCDPTLTVGNLYDHQKFNLKGVALEPTAPAIPCGLIAKSVFTDRYTLRKKGALVNEDIKEDGIAWASDL